MPRCMAGAPHRRDLLRAGVAAPFAMLMPPPVGGTGLNSIRDRAARRGRRYGAAVRADTLGSDPALRRAVLSECDWITPEIDFKWNALEYRRGGWWFERADALVAFAQANGKALRGHTLLWEQSTPDWARAELAERRDWRLVERWFATALGRYGDTACEWDVINEPIDTEHGRQGLRRTCFHGAFGADYIPRAMRLARHHAPNARLFINEYGLDYGNHVERDRRRALLKLVARLRHDGVPLDGIGVQAHLDLSKGPLDARAITAMLREIADLGLSISITELDVAEADRTRPLAARDRAIADEVRRYLDIVLAEPAVTGVVSWGVSDRDSWLQDGLDTANPDQLNRGLPFDVALQPKPVYFAMREALTKAQA